MQDFTLFSAGIFETQTFYFELKKSLLNQTVKKNENISCDAERYKYILQGEWNVAFEMLTRFAILFLIKYQLPLRKFS